MSALALIEGAILRQVGIVLGSRLRTLASVPAAFGEAEMKDRLRQAPAVYAGFLGGEANPQESTAAVLDAKFGLYALTAQAAGERARRLGDGRQIGAYDILETLIPALHGLVLKDDEGNLLANAGTLTFLDAQNLWADALDEAGVSLYAASFGVRLALVPALPDDLAPFETFCAQYDIPPFPPVTLPLPEPAGQVDAADLVTLPTD